MSDPSLPPIPPAPPPPPPSDSPVGGQGSSSGVKTALIIAAAVASAGQLVPQPDLGSLDAALQCRVEGGRAAADRELLYCLHSDLVLGLGQAMEEARAESNGVNLIFRDGRAGIDWFNELVALCFDQAPECPRGQLAVVYGDTVISAATVNAPSFERDQVVVSAGDDGWIQQDTLVKAMVDADIQPVWWAVPIDGP